MQTHRCAGIGVAAVYLGAPVETGGDRGPARCPGFYSRLQGEYMMITIYDGLASGGLSATANFLPAPSGRSGHRLSPVMRDLMRAQPEPTGIGRARSQGD